MRICCSGKDKRFRQQNNRQKGARTISRNIFKGFRFTDGILLLALFFVGGFHEFISCILSAAMVFWLLLRLADGKAIRIEKGLYLWTIATLCIGYGATCLWAVDRGMSFVGFLKFLPLILYAVCLWQNEESGKVLQLLPFFGVLCIVVSAIGMQIPGFAGYFSVNGRLSGFFQYPNTFAIFLLVCQLLVLKKESKTVWDYLIILALTAGILYSGSRVVLAILLLSNAVMLFVCLPKKRRLPLALSLLGILLVGFLLALDSGSVLNRYQIESLLKTSLTDRLLYILDSLPLLLKYPFGMGYMGYYYIQKSIQTGMYATTYVHSDFLQVFLDIGWIPGILLIAALIRWFTRKSIPAGDKVVVGALCFHCLLDFDLQYMAMAMLLLLLTHKNNAGKQILIKDRFLIKTALTVTLTLNLYMGTALAFAHTGQHVLADTLYPYNTANIITMLEQSEDMQEASELAQRILLQNQTYHAPYEVQAKYCYSRGDFAGLIENKNKSFQADPFSHRNYQEYCEMLINGIDMYAQAGDWESVKICQEELLAAEEKLSANAQRLSLLGRQLSVQPVTQLSDSVRSYIAGLKGDSQ